MLYCFDLWCILRGSRWFYWAIKRKGNLKIALKNQRYDWLIKTIMLNCFIEKKVTVKIKTFLKLDY